MPGTAFGGCGCAMIRMGGAAQLEGSDGGGVSQPVPMHRKE